MIQCRILVTCLWTAHVLTGYCRCSQFFPSLFRLWWEYKSQLNFCLVYKTFPWIIIVSFWTTHICCCLLYGSIVLRWSLWIIFEAVFELKCCSFPPFIWCDTRKCSSHFPLNGGLPWVSGVDKIILSLGSFWISLDRRLSVASLCGLGHRWLTTKFQLCGLGQHLTIFSLYPWLKMKYFSCFARLTNRCANKTRAFKFMVAYRRTSFNVVKSVCRYIPTLNEVWKSPRLDDYYI